tara:strand:- start:2082 stop:2342 length:261 start_codon:yes stop_codon:yes gene_type:complete
MRKTTIGLAAAAGITLATLAVPAVLQAHESGASRDGMMMQGGSSMMERMSRMMDRCESMMQEMGNDARPQDRKSEGASPTAPGSSG